MSKIGAQSHGDVNLSTEGKFKNPGFRANLLQSMLFCILFSGLPFQSYSSHFAAADLSLLNIGGNSYRITCALYKDCSGATAPTMIPLFVRCYNDSTINFMVTLQPLAGTGQEMTPSCSAIPTYCSGGTTYGIKEYVYQAIVTLAQCSNWVLSYSSCCRNPSTTIQSPTTASLFICALLNNSDAPGNSLPYFTSKPIQIICSGQPAWINAGAIDMDGDSLSYSLVSPMTTDINSYVTWLSGFSAQQPLPSMPPVSIDPVTGDLCMTPTMNILTPICIRVDSWRKINNVSVNVGTVFRDMQLNVISCNNHIPVLSGMDTTLSAIYDPNDTIYSISKCIGSTIQFTIKGHDDDTFNQTTTGSPHAFYISWNHGIPGANFQVLYNGTDSAYAQFSWTPNSNHLSNVPHCFTATIHDEACPYYGVQTYSYCITIQGLFVEIGNDTILCKGESIIFNALADTSTVNYIWKLNGNLTGTPLSSASYSLNTSSLTPGLYVISIETNDGSPTLSCPGKDKSNLQVIYQPNVDLGNDTIACHWAVITLDAGPGYAYGWNTGAVTQTIQVHNASGTYIAYVDGGNGTRCLDSDTIQLQFDTCTYLIESGMNRLSVYPNPFSQNLNLQADPSLQGPYFVQLIDARGKSIPIEIDEGDDKYLITIRMPSSLSPGVYMLRITNQHGGTRIFKIVRE
jgi:hypothetical protein